MSGLVVNYSLQLIGGHGHVAMVAGISLSFRLRYAVRGEW